MIFLAFALLPFIESIGNRTEGILGKLGHDGAFYPVFLGVVLWIGHCIVNKDKIYIPQNNSFKLLLILLAWVLITSIFNFDNILVLNFQGKKGIDRFVIQYSLLIFYLLIPLYIFNMAKKIQNFEYIIIKGIKISLFISILYMVIEFGYFFHINFLSNILYNLNGMFRGDELIYFKIRSVAGEASLFGFYVAFVLPFIMFYAFVKEKSIYLFSFVFIVVGAICSFSRTVYVVTLIEIILFSILFIKKLFYNKKYIIGSSLIYVTFFSAILFYFENEVSLLSDYNVFQIIESLTSSSADGDMQSMSNAARYGSQVASWNVFLMAPVLGVGWGQEGFYIADFYPEWAWVSSEVTEWAINGQSYTLPSTFNVFLRFLCCAGIIGGILWCTVWISECYKLIKLISYNESKLIFIVIIGIVILWGSSDQVRFFGMWMAMGVSWINTESRIMNENTCDVLTTISSDKRK